MGVVVGVDVGGGVVGGGVVVDFEGRPVDARGGHPVVVTLVEVLEVDVVAIGILISSSGRIIIYN